jgi:predicted PhzF superfamily epimerase YddE/YHI9
VRKRIFVVDSFTDEPFSGNPAGVCLLQQQMSDDWMQSVAAEMRHAETAFVRFTGECHELRWFTPTVEVDLCGHATLAAAHVLWTEDLHSKWQPIQFHTKSGILKARLDGYLGVLDFPAEAPEECDQPLDVREILGSTPTWFGRNRMDWIAVLDSEQAVRTLLPKMDAIEQMGMRGLMVTAQSEGEYDFVSRFFAPQSGVPEDPVTGSAHCCLGPFWGERLGKLELRGYQASQRGGVVGVRLRGDRVDLIGTAVTVLEGRLLQ